MKKTVVSASLSLALAAVMGLSALAADAGLISPAAGNSADTAPERTYTIQVNGEDTGIQACVMVPLRAIAEKLGFQVTWSNGTVLVDNGVMHTTVTIGKDSYIVTTSNPDLVGMSAPFSLGAAPYVTDGVTYVPLGLFDALLGSKEGTIAVEGSKILIHTDSGSTELANPFTDCTTLKEAQDLAGFSITVPEASSACKETRIRVIKGSLIEVVYANGEEELCIRKGSGSGDVSGDYNFYAQTKSVTVDGLQVTMKGADGEIRLATWSSGGYTFAVSSSQGVSASEMTNFIQAVK
ncbi:copper amine oxidase N-terminal domain-containing protein [Oscillibacter hominis]|uniref:Copper amine oxidase N-terminal domain-containing protein n=1 Tax=Oscillibacter hominis TaxID=2763056 RepID=A0A7G9B3L1_9FIRM|nr:copper amine oxidase N-terminal domain-containing protein [Oscillibacter hominis]QNL44142.1 copper amine oxidase N-terminal domain-containing protein [Oscillibacter hominis]